MTAALGKGVERKCLQSVGSYDGAKLIIWWC